MEVYIITTDVRIDGEMDNDIGGYILPEDAAAEFERIKEEFWQLAQDYGWHVDTDTDTAFEAYEESYECGNHCYLSITLMTPK